MTMVRTRQSVFALAAMVLCCVTDVVAQEPVASAPEKPLVNKAPSLASVVWEGQPVSIEMLRGKTVLILVYATWCPKCNQWSGSLFRQMKEAISGKPVFILAINADDRLDPSLSYVKERGFVAPNVLHGYDPSIAKRLGFKSNLFRYAIVSPDGTLQGTGSAGSYLPNGKSKQFVIAKRLAKAPGEFMIFRPDMPEDLQRLFWPMEMGQVVPDAILKKARARLDASGKERFDTAFNEFLGTRLDEIRKNYSGELLEKLLAYEQAELLARTYPASKQGKAARRGIEKIGKDRDFKRELAAKKYYDKMMSLAVSDPNRLRKSLRLMASRFRGTHYGNLAAEALAKR